MYDLVAFVIDFKILIVNLGENQPLFHIYLHVFLHLQFFYHGMMGYFFLHEKHKINYSCRFRSTSPIDPECPIDPEWVPKTWVSSLECFQFLEKQLFFLSEILECKGSILKLFQHTKLEHTPSNLYQQAI